MPDNQDPYLDGLRRKVGRLLLSPQQQAEMKEIDAMIARAPKLKDRPRYIDRAKDVAGKVWAAPNTAIGLAYGLAGTAVGAAMGTNPKIRRGENGIDFVNNPLAGLGAITLGNTTSWGQDPKDPRSFWYTDQEPWTPEREAQNFRHEAAHTRQSEQLGPLYLPANIIGGVSSVIAGKPKDGDPSRWHTDVNFMERGPKQNPPAPWPRRPR